MPFFLVRAEREGDQCPLGVSRPEGRAQLGCHAWRLHCRWTQTPAVLMGFHRCECDALATLSLIRSNTRSS